MQGRTLPENQPDSYWSAMAVHDQILDMFCDCTTAGDIEIQDRLYEALYGTYQKTLEC